MSILLFATNNPHKLAEIQHIFESNLLLKDKYQVLGLNDTGFTGDIEEPHETLEANALEKARHIKARSGMDCFADDTGLEIEALGGRPGVYAARYAGEGCSFDDNITKVLREMKGMTNRKACFRTVIALILDGNEYLFEGRVDGEILEERRGNGGFGYDPVFKPEGYELTFAEMDMKIKNRISHRGRAVMAMVEWMTGGLENGDVF